MTVHARLHAPRDLPSSGAQSPDIHRGTGEPVGANEPNPVNDAFSISVPAPRASQTVTAQLALRRPASPIASDDGSLSEGSIDWSDGYEEASIDDDDFCAPDAGDRDSDNIREQVQTAVQILGQEGRISHFGREIKFILPTQQMPQSTRISAGITQEGVLKVIVDAQEGFSSKAPKPQLQVVFGPGNATDKVCRTGKLNAEFPMGILLIKTLEKYLERAWPPRAETDVLDMYNALLASVEDAGDNCMLCVDALAYGGNNLTVCDSELCCFQFESLGLGASLSLLHSEPQTADFLISASMSALSVVHLRPSVMPTLPTDTKGETIAAAQALLTLTSLPSMADFALEPGRDLRLLETAHADAPRLLRWIFATNRAHLTPLPPERRFEAIKTTHQFEISSSTRKHAADFASLKEQHGSLFAFHGSGFYNWHNILRNNLKNASGTAMMSTGAIYGAGIYLAPDLQTSMSYAPPSSAWAGSNFGSLPRCMALCEVVNAPQLIKPLQGIYVAPSEHLVTLRYLFVFDGKEAISNVHASQLSLQKYHNDTTIAGQEPIDSVPRERLVVTSDGYAWDIDELTQLIAAKNGLFINGYTQKGFAPADVKAILEHKLARGPLQKLEASNMAAKSLISRPTLDYARRVGAICKNDKSVDFASSMKAIGELRDHLAALPEKEREALARAPFDALDSHTQQAMRDTVSNALASVAQGGECIHKFGDFLSQLQ